MNKLYYSSVASGKALEHRFGEFMLMRQHGKQGRDGNGYGISSQDQSGRSAQSQSFGGDRHATACLRPMSRADLAKETGLTKATMSLLVSLLIDAGVVKEGEPQNSASYGRRPRR